MTLTSELYPDAPAPGGVNTNVQFNDGGAFGGQAGFEFTKATNILNLSGRYQLGGVDALRMSRGDLPGSCNIFIGNTGNTTNIGNLNVVCGENAMKYNTSGFSNVVYGGYAAFLNESGYVNTIIGMNALSENRIGYGNVALGCQAGHYALGDGNVFLGTRAGFNEIGSNKLYIANTNTSTPLIWGDFNTAALIFNCTADLAQLQNQPTGGTALAIATTQYSDIWENGVTGSRPGSPSIGERYFDTTLGIPIWYNGWNWVNAAGAIV